MRYDHSFIPSISAYTDKLASSIIAKQTAIFDIDVTFETELLCELTSKNSDLYKKVRKLEDVLKKVKGIDANEKAVYYSDKVFSAMQKVREIVDSIEPHMPSDFWPVPTYSDMLFYI